MLQNRIDNAEVTKSLINVCTMKKTELLKQLFHEVAKKLDRLNGYSL